MSTIETLPTQFNGVIDTTQPVMSNLETLCTAARCWLTFDINVGKWSVVINKSGTSVASFNNSNIIGGINISGTGLTELYNKVRVEFPHVELNDQKDYISIAIPTVDRFDNERDNTLEMSLDIVNDPIWTEMLAATELKQSRVDKIIEFRTDYSKLGLKAGDLIDVTASMYGYTNKIFRIVTIAEEDSDDGTIQLSITALEYDADVYDYSNLNLYERQRSTGITPDSINSAVIGSNNLATTTSVSNSLLDPTNAALIALLMNALTRTGSGVGLNPVVSVITTNIITATVANGTPTTINLGYSFTAPYTGIYKTTYSINWGGTGNPSIVIGGTPYLWGVLKNSSVVLVRGGSAISTSPGFTGDVNVQLYEDHLIDVTYSLTQGQVITYYFTYATDWGGDYGGNGGAGTNAIFLINAETKFVGR
jgi:hypothetical protein